MKRIFNSATPLAACFALAVSLITPLAARAADVDGTWTWSRPGRDGGEARTSTLVLKADGEKLTGKLTTPGRGGGDPVATDITEGTIKDGAISFKVSREFGGNTFVQTYTGKIAGDTLTGQIAFEREGQTQTREWSAKREAAKAAQ